MTNAAHRAIRSVTERFVETVNKEMQGCNCRIKAKTIGTGKSVFTLIEGCNYKNEKPVFTRFHKVKINTLIDSFFEDVVITYSRDNREVAVNII